MAYIPTTWKDGDIITAERLNKLEQGVQNEQVVPQGPAGATGATGPQGPKGEPGESYTLPAATTGALGGVKMCENVAEAAGENVTKAEFNALLTALKNAGIMSST